MDKRRGEPPAGRPRAEHDADDSQPDWNQPRPDFEAKNRERREARLADRDRRQKKRRPMAKPPRVDQVLKRPLAMNRGLVQGVDESDEDYEQRRLGYQAQLRRIRKGAG